MKMLHKIVALLLIIILMNINGGYVFAHQEMLDISYENCNVPVDDEGDIIETDGENEMWYAFYSRHISHEVYTIKYYFNEFAKDDNTYTWTSECSLEEANSIKEAFANSMKKWNNIYYYSYDANGNRVANKIINIVEIQMV